MNLDLKTNYHKFDLLNDSTFPSQVNETYNCCNNTFITRTSKVSQASHIDAHVL